MRDPKLEELQRIIKAHLDNCDITNKEIDELIRNFIARRDKYKEQLATDQLLNALFMIVRQREWVGDEKDILLDHLLAPLDRELKVEIRGRKPSSTSKSP